MINKNAISLAAVLAALSACGDATDADWKETLPEEESSLEADWQAPPDSDLEEHGAVGPADLELRSLEAPSAPTVASAPESRDVVDKIYGSGLSPTPTFSAVGLAITRPPDWNGSTVGRCSGVLLNNYVLLTAAHCLQPANSSTDSTRTPIGNGWHSTAITYESPSGSSFSGTNTVTRNMFFYQHDLYDGSGSLANTRYDIAVGATNTSFGLSNTHFAMLSRTIPAVGDGLFVGGYGAPNTGQAWQLEVTANSVTSGRLGWTSVRAWQGACAGDSGSQHSTASGSFSGALPKWWNVSALTIGTSSVDNFAPSCNNNGSAVTINQHRAWIQEIVEFWPETARGTQCKNWTNPAGDAVSWCWP